MKIWGGNDYYDCGMAMGQDPSITLLRYKGLKVEGIDLGNRVLEYRDRYGVGNNFRSVVVVFCGKMYQGAIFKGSYDGFEQKEPQCFWSADKLGEWVAGIKGAEVRVRSSWSKRGKYTLDDYFTPKPVSDEVREYMIRNRIAILVGEPKIAWSRVEQPHLYVNPYNLKQLGFAKALDPYTAFQELSMWIGGVLGGSSPETIAITDDRILAESHGFDRYSFRSQARR